MIAGVFFFDLRIGDSDRATLLGNSFLWSEVPLWEAKRDSFFSTTSLKCHFFVTKVDIFKDFLGVAQVTNVHLIYLSSCHHR
jgi:hypothetical protein